MGIRIALIPLEMLSVNLFVAMLFEIDKDEAPTRSYGKRAIRCMTNSLFASWTTILIVYYPNLMSAKVSSIEPLLLGVGMTLLMPWIRVKLPIFLNDWWEIKRDRFLDSVARRYPHKFDIPEESNESDPGQEP